MDYRDIFANTRSNSPGFRHAPNWWVKKRSLSDMASRFIRQSS